MSVPSISSETEKSSLNVPDILADFFLKKIEMGSYSDDSSHKHKGKKKKSKRKKGKYKKSKHRHRSRSSSKEYQRKETNEDVSSSDEINIKRLKKIKSLKLNSKINPVLQSTTKLAADETMEKRYPSSSSSGKNLVFYGPSLELLLSGVESNSVNVESGSASGVIIDVYNESNCSEFNKTKCFDVNNKINSPFEKKDIIIVPENVTNDNLVPEQDLNNSDKLKEYENVFVKSDETSIEDCNVNSSDSANILKKNINESVVTNEINNDSFNLCKINANKTMTLSVANNSNFSDICEKDIDDHLNFSEKNETDCLNSCGLNDGNFLNVIGKNDSDAISMPGKKEDKNTSFNKNENDMESLEKESVMNVKIDVLKNTNKTTNKVKVEKNKSKNKDKRKSHSRSRSRSRSKTFKNNSKIKMRRKSRSSSRGSHTKTKRKHSRSLSHEKSKLHTYGKQSPQRNHSRTKYRQSHSKSPRRSRSHSHSRYNRHSRSRSRKRSHSRSRSHSVSRSRSRFNSKSHRNNKSCSRSRSRSKCRKTSKSKEVSRSRSRSKPKEETSRKIDQAKILETARRNVLKMMKDGTLPEGLNVENMKKEHLISIHAGGKSVQELTEFCQRLSQKENDPDEDNNDETSDNDTGFIHHPFKVKEPAMIKLNIKNAVQLPIKSHSQKIAELSSQFPVSSGNQHKQKELEWIPVVPDSPKTEIKAVDKKVAVLQNATSIALVENPVSSTSLQSQIPVSYPCPSQLLTVPITSVPPILPPPMPPSIFIPSMNTSMPALLPPPQIEMQYTMPKNQPMMTNISLTAPMPALSTSVFKSAKNIDISTIVTKRFQALTKLQEDPNDPDALGILQNAQQDIQDWVQSQQVPGLFTGSTDAKVLSVAELCGPKYYNKFRKDFFTNAPPVSEGKGMSLLKKMGWNPGEGLGKNKEGSLEPLVLDIKMDKKGLVSEGENSKKGLVNSFTKELQGKHPVSALMELCSKRKWKPPLYTCIMDVGPPHKKLFCFKVEVNGVEYQPVNPCANKKVAKADAAVICLQALNVFPKNPT